MSSSTPAGQRRPAARRRILALTGISAAAVVVACLGIPGHAIGRNGPGASGSPGDTGGSTTALAAVDAQSTASVTAAAALPKPAARWSFDEGSGTSAKDAAGGDDATLGSGASWSAGHLGAHAVTFTGSSNSTATAPKPAVDTSKSFTVSAWVDFSSVSGYQTITGIDGDTIGGFFLQLSGTTGKFAMTRRTGDSTSATEVRADSSVAPKAGTWYHVVGVDDVEHSTLKVYVDGEEGTDASFGSAWKASGATSIGRGDFGGPTDYLHGAVDQVEYYQAALTPAQVANLDEAAHWTYDEGTGTTASDSTGNGASQTLASGASWTTGRIGAHALALDGTADGHASTAKPPIDTGESFSVAAWVKLNKTSGFQDVATVDGENTSAFYLQQRGDTGKFAFTRLDSDATSAKAVFASSKSKPKAGTWYHLVGVYDKAASSLSLYVNGALQSTVDYSGGWTASGPFEVGRGLFSKPADFLDGAVDDMQVMDYPATANEVGNLIGSAGGILTVDAADALHKLPSTFFGLMTEDINHSMTGGLYAELINNRSMMASTNKPVDWNPVGGVSISLDASTPLNSALTRSLRIDVSDAGRRSPAGVANGGYWGIPVAPSRTYTASLFAKASAGFRGPLTLSIESSDGSTVYAQARVRHVSSHWKRYTATLRTRSSAPVTADARYVVSTADNSGRTLWLDDVSLFPPTYQKNNVAGCTHGHGHKTCRFDGVLRSDLMTDLAKLKPAFIREPGGNYLEGNTLATRFDWKKTIGPDWTRPGHEDDAWGYFSTDGMGLLEYLEWCEQLGAQPMLAVYAGYSLNHSVVSKADLAPYVQDALDEIQYATGPVTSEWGAQRAKDGHPAPFKISYVEVGNEDQFDGTGSYNSYRFPMFYDAIKKAYPSMKVIATTPVTSRTPDVVDDHFYESPSWMNEHADEYDDTSRSGPKVLVGEWASQEGTPTPDLASAIGDASWLTGLMRNSDVVMGESYAPMLVNVNDDRWKTNLIGFDATTSYVSPSYWVQEMLAQNHGDQVISADYSGVGGLNVVATRNSRTGEVDVVIVNPDSSEQKVQIDLSGVKHPASHGTQIVLSSGSQRDTNTISAPNTVSPQTKPLTGVSSDFTHTVPGNSVSVLRLN